MRRNFHAAFTATIPVLLAYLVVGMAFGLLMDQAGYSPLWSLLASVTVYAGTMQFVLVTLLTGQAGLITAALMTLAVNFRHVFYGFSMFDRFSGMGLKKFYMMFSLTDETYSLLCVAEPPDPATKKQFYFLVALLNQCYWISGCVLGNIFGQFALFNTTGIEFSMTALFVVTCVEQWEKRPNRRPALIGAGCAVAALAAFGADGMVIPAMLAIAVLLLVFRGGLEEKKAGEKA